MIEDIVILCMIGFFGVLTYSLARLVMFGRKCEGLEQVPLEPIPKPKSKKLWRLEQPSKPWPIIVEPEPVFYVKEINGKVVIVIGEPNA